MKKTHIYESPAVRYCDIDMNGFICASGLKVQVDRWDSIDGGNIDFDDDAVILSLD